MPIPEEMLSYGAMLAHDVFSDELRAEPVTRRGEALKYLILGGTMNAAIAEGDRLSQLSGEFADFDRQVSLYARAAARAWLRLVVI